MTVFHESVPVVLNGLYQRSQNTMLYAVLAGLYLLAAWRSVRLKVSVQFKVAVGPAICAREAFATLLSKNVGCQVPARTVHYLASDGPTHLRPV